LSAQHSRANRVRFGSDMHDMHAWQEAGENLVQSVARNLNAHGPANGFAELVEI